MDPIKIIQKYYQNDSQVYNILLEHSELVTKKALSIADKVKNLNPDLQFIKEAGMLHDIGIYLTKDLDIGCTGDKPYICHGYLGRELLEKEGYPKHGLVCERHVGVGISIDDIEKFNLLLPSRDMVPLTIEEKLICFADKFYSKRKDENNFREKSLDEVKKGLLKFGDEKVKIFDEWLELFNVK